jgi:hypothetical protein
MVNWLVDKVNRQWINIFEYIQRHGNTTSSHNGDHGLGVMGQLSVPFETNRTEIFNKTSSSVDIVVRSYDKVTEANRFSSKV